MSIYVEATNLANAIAQGWATRAQADTWFMVLDPWERLEAYQALAFITTEARPVAAEVELSGSISGQPAVGGEYDEFGEFRPAPQSVEDQDLVERGFCFLVCLFAVADTRRRLTQCANGCEHPWHRDESAAVDLIERFQPILCSDE